MEVDLLGVRRGRLHHHRGAARQRCAAAAASTRRGLRGTPRSRRPCCSPRPRSMRRVVVPCSTAARRVGARSRPAWTSTSSGRSRPPPSGRPSTPSSTRRSARRAPGPAARGARALRLTRHEAGHAARSRRDLLLPALHALQAHAGWISQPGPQPHLPAPVGAARRGLRRGDLLCALLDDAAPGRGGARLRRHRVPPRRRRGALRAASSDASGPEGERLVAEPLPGTLRARTGGARDPRRRARARASSSPRPTPRAPGAHLRAGDLAEARLAAGPLRAPARPAQELRLLAGSASSTPRPWRTIGLHGGYRRPDARAAIGPPGRHRRGHGVGSRRARRRSLPDGPQVERRRCPARRSPTTSSATPTNRSPAPSRTASSSRPTRSRSWRP